MIRRYMNYLSNIRGMAQNTCRCYHKDLQHFITWARENVHDARWSTMTREHIDAYVTWQADNGLSASTTNRRLASISSFYNWLRREGYLKENPCKYEARRKVSSTQPNTIPCGQLCTAYENAEGVTKVMIGLLATTGVRIQELLAMTYEAINFETCAIKIHGKGAKDRIVYATPETLATLCKVQEIYNYHGKIFTINQRTARHMIWECLRQYCFAPQLSPHAIRHTYATNLANKGTNVTTIGKVLGHSHIETTQKYIDMNQAPIREVNRGNSIINLNPNNNE